MENMIELQSSVQDYSQVLRPLARQNATQTGSLLQDFDGGTGMGLLAPQIFLPSLALCILSIKYLMANVKPGLPRLLVALPFVALNLVAPAFYKYSDKIGIISFTVMYVHAWNANLRVTIIKKLLSLKATVLLNFLTLSRCIPLLDVLLD